jgi:urea transport system substrate-binding protein
MTKPSIPLGLIFSRSGPYAMMGREMEKSALMAVDEVNQSEEFDFTFTPHLRDPGGVVPAYHTACEDLIRSERVEHIVGCYTSASRKQVIPIVERTERLLWHPARYEGFESSDNVIYVGAAPNHTVVPLVRHALEHIASDVFCVGSNYVWTWETNRVLREFVTSARGRLLAERLLELGDTSVDHIVSEIIDRRPPAVFNTLVGESSYSFMRALHATSVRAGISIPMLSCSLCEPELKMIGPAASVGCITSSAYFESIEGPDNRAFVARWKARHGNDSHVSVDSQSTYTCIMLLARAICRAGSADVAAVRRAAANNCYNSPQGPIWVDPDNNHCFLTPRLARSVDGCQFDIFWQADAPERPDPYLSHLDFASVGARPDKQGDATVRRPTHLRVVK